MPRARAAYLLAAMVALLACAGCRQTSKPTRQSIAPASYRDICPRWSPGGDKIAFLRRWSDGRASVMLANADLSGIRALTQPTLLDPDVPIRTGRERVTGAQQIAWTPDGRRIVYPAAEEIEGDEGETRLGIGIWDVSVTGGQPRRLVSAYSKAPRTLLTCRSIAWSPAGGFYAFVARGDRGETAVSIRSSRAPLEADEPLPLFDPDLDADLPTWSPDGTRLAFRRADSRALTADTIEKLRVIEPGGKSARDIWTLTSQGYGALVGQPAPAGTPRIVEIAWSPDRSQLAVTVTPDPHEASVRETWIVQAEGDAAPRRLPGSWIGVAWSGEHRLVALRRDGAAFEAAAIDVATGEASRLARVDADDCDWSPDRRVLVCGCPNVEGPAAHTTLRVLQAGS